MTNPIDIITQAIRTADGNHTRGAGRLAEVAADALTDDRIVDAAAIALLGDGESAADENYNWPLREVDHITDGATTRFLTLRRYQEVDE